MTYPKWVNRGYGLGDVLCVSAEEEEAFHKHEAARLKEAESGEVETEEDADVVAPTVEELRAKLDALGIKYHPNAGVKKLAALLPAE